VTGAGTTTYGYDRADQIVSIVPPSGANHFFSFDQRGNLTQRRDGVTPIQDYAWNAANRLTSATVPPSSLI